VLVMTATPIPRTLALTAYGDLDVSVIRELPPGRVPIRTTAQPQSRRDEVHAFIRREVDAGRQAYIVYPLIEESEKVDLRAATEMADHLAAEVFPEYRLALLHGRLRPDQKDRIMRAFAAGRRAGAGVDHGHRGRHRRAERKRDGDRACGAIRPVADSPVARPRGARRTRVILRSAVPGAAR